MTIFDALTLIGGLCLFLFGMGVMGDALERRAGNSLKNILARLTKNKIAGFLTGLGVTAVIQSSSATTVMVVGFVNSGIMTLRQSIGVIMGANIGTTVTAWVLSLGGISAIICFYSYLSPHRLLRYLRLSVRCFLCLQNQATKRIPERFFWDLPYLCSVWTLCQMQFLVLLIYLRSRICS